MGEFKKIEPPKEKNKVKLNIKLIVLILIFMLFINIIGIYNNKMNTVSSNLQFSQVEQQIMKDGEEGSQTLEIAQDISKYIKMENNVLVQQDIYTSISNSNQNRKQEVINIVVPNMEGKYPENIKVIVDGKKLDESQIKYDNTTGTLEINNIINEEKNLETKKIEYDIVYLYASNNEIIENKSGISKNLFTLNTKVSTLLNDNTVIEQESKTDVETEEKGNIIDIQKELLGEVYKGYMYANIPKEVSYKEINKIRISKADESDILNIIDENALFADTDNKLYNTEENVIYKSTIINKEQLSRLFGEDYEIIIETSEQDEEELTQSEQEDNQSSEIDQTEGENPESNKIIITKETEANENGDIVINYEDEVYYTKITTNKPINEGHLVINHEKAIKGNGNYNKEQLKQINKLINSSNVLEKENKANSTAVIELKETRSEAKISVNPKDLSIVNENKDIQILVLLKNDNEKCELYKNPNLEIKLPEDTEKVTINSIDLLYNDDNFTIGSNEYDQEGKTLKIQMRGQQTDYKSGMEEGILVKISLDIKFKQDIPSKEVPIVLMYSNQNAENETYETTDSVKLNAKAGTILYNNVSGYSEKNEEVETIDNKVVDANLNTNIQEIQPTVHQAFINNYDKPLENVKIIGTLKNENVEKEKINITLATSINTNKENAVVYYSNKENITAEDESWVEDISQLNEVKSYKIELNESLGAYEKVDINYNLKIPQGLEKGKESNYQTEATYEYQGIAQNNNAITSFKTPEVTKSIELESGLKVEYLAKSAGQRIKAGDEIYDGQAIEYEVTLTNNTGRNLTNIQLTAKHTNAVYYVEKKYGVEIATGDDIITQKDYEAKQIDKTLEVLPNNGSATISYIIATNGNAGDEVSGNITIKANELENSEVITTDVYKIKESKLIVDIENEMGENQRIAPGDPIGYAIKVTNNTNSILNDITLKVPHSKNLILEMTDNLIKGTNITSVENDYLIIKIPNLRSGSSFIAHLTFKLDEIKVGQNDERTFISAVATVEGETYYSRELERLVEKITADLSGEQFLKAEQKVVQNGDKLTYTAKITNNDKKLTATNLCLSHSVTRVNAQIDDAYLLTNTGKLDAKLDLKDEDDNKTAHHASVLYELQPGETVEYTANASICDNPSTWYGDEEDVTSSMSLTWDVNGYLELNKVSVSYKNQDANFGVSDNSSNTDGDYDGQDNNNNNSQTNNEKHSISGMAWLDENKNGKKDSNEKGIPNLEVSLLNSETGNSTSTTRTESSGTYRFENVDQGKYVVAFEYDTNVYSPTEYKASGVLETENSDVIQKQNNSQAITDVITLSYSDITDIDAGFKQNLKFDLSLNKAITKVTTKNGEGTKEQKYTKEKLAKTEIHAKQVENSVVTIEYVIEVKNEGEIAGFVSDIKDYKPKDMEFNERDNPGWKLENDGTLHNTSLANTKLEAGQTEELTLVLTKKGIGNVRNTAEIAEATNEYSQGDQDSIPNNNKKNEDDISTAEVIISVKTGLTETLLGIMLVVVVLLIIATFIFHKKRKGGYIDK